MGMSVHQNINNNLGIVIECDVCNKAIKNVDEDAFVMWHDNDFIIAHSECVTDELWELYPDGWNDLYELRPCVENLIGSKCVFTKEELDKLGEDTKPKLVYVKAVFCFN